MLVCPKCHTQYAEPREFCELDGVRLIAESTPSSAKGDSEKPDPPTKDEPAADTAELDQLQGRIRELEAKLAAADLELKKLRATSTDKKTVAEPADKKTVAESTDKKTAAEPADKKTLAESPDKKTAAESTDKKTAGEPADKRAPAEPEPTEVVEAAEVMHGWLLGIDGVVKGKRFGIPARGIKIGRGKRVQILIEDENVSNTHAWVGVEKNRVIVRDQGSTNGTFINDPDSKPIKEARLSEGDTIIIAGKRGIAEFMFSK